MKPSMNIGVRATLPVFANPMDQSQMIRQTLPVFPQQGQAGFATPQHGWGNEHAMNQTWFQQNHPALQQWFQQQLGMKPTGLFPFAPDRRLLG